MTDRDLPTSGATDTSIATGLMRALTRAATKEEFLQDTLRTLLAGIGGDAAALVEARHGWWQPTVSVTAPDHKLAADQAPMRWPEETIAEAVDAGRPLRHGRWCVIPLRLDQAATDAFPRPGAAGHAGNRMSGGWLSPGVDLAEVDSRLQTSALVLRVGVSRDGHSAGGHPLDPISETLPEIAALVAWGIRQRDVRDRQARRIAELGRVLQAAATWQRLDSDEQLLKAIADAACELLGCERASIFLWDRRRRKLVGRPALGMGEDSLEVDDDAGVVGEVLRSGEPQVWNAGRDDEQRVNRAVDAQTDFETRSLVAVPMFAPRGQPASRTGANAASDRSVIGVFEALNRSTAEAEPASGFDHRDAALLADLAAHAAAAIDSLRTRQSLTATRDRLVDDAAMATRLIGQHPSMESVRETARKVARTDLTVLVLGQNGTGKEVLARHIHYESDRRHGPFIAVNCAALVESLLESELFGHERGAFTDAQQTRAGKFELAHGGTLFLDEVGDMSPGGQSKLLRVLEEKVVVRVGGAQPIPVDVRVIAATNQPLTRLVEEKRFRQDLFFRLNVVSLVLPPLQERGDDVLRLSEHFLAEFCAQIGRPMPSFSPAARQTLLNHPWPGNVRELRNTIERVCYLTSGDTVESADLMLSDSATTRLGGTATREGWPEAPLLAEATREFQAAHIERAIAACRGNMTEAASLLGLHRSNLYRKMRQLGMSTSGDGSPA